MQIKEEYQQETIIRKSRFLCILRPVHTEEEARAFIHEVQKEYHDATHVCTAWVMGKNNQLQRSNDHGEPAGTAGVPMLEALKKSGIQDVCACVVRWFGGIKLGAGGLIRAYGGITADTIAGAPKVMEVPMDVYEVRYPYAMQGTLETWLRQQGTIKDTLYDEDITVLVETENKTFPEKVKDLSRGTVTPKYLRTMMVFKDAE